MTRAIAPVHLGPGAHQSHECLLVVLVARRGQVGCDQTRDMEDIGKHLSLQLPTMAAAATVDPGQSLAGDRIALGQDGVLREIRSLQGPLGIQVQPAPGQQQHASQGTDATQQSLGPTLAVCHAHPNAGLGQIRPQLNGVRDNWGVFPGLVSRNA
jgi:hypothetical protein